MTLSHKISIKALEVCYKTLLNETASSKPKNTAEMVKVVRHLKQLVNNQHDKDFNISCNNVQYAI